MKRLDVGTFRRVVADDGRDHIEIDAGELAMSLEGIDAPVIHRRKRRSRTAWRRERPPRASRA